MIISEERARSGHTGDGVRVMLDHLHASGHDGSAGSLIFFLV